MKLRDIAAPREAAPATTPAAPEATAATTLAFIVAVAVAVAVMSVCDVRTLLVKYALALLRMTFVASAPAPARERAPTPPLAASDAADDVAEIVAPSLADSAIAPDVEATPFAALST